MQNYVVQGNFTAGELSPLLRGRADVEMFFSGASELKNCSVLTQGGVQRRPGTKFLHSFGAAPSVRVYRSQIREDEAYLLVFANGSLTVFDAITNTVITTVQSHGYSEEDIPDLSFYQSLDVIFVAHPLHPVRKIVNRGSGDWAILPVSLKNGPFLDRTTDDAGTRMAVGILSDRVTLTADSALFTSASAGSHVEYHRDGLRYLGRIIEKSSDTSVIVLPLEDQCFTLSKEVYSPGVYNKWDNGKPVYDPIPSVEGGLVDVCFSSVGVVTRAMIGGYMRFSDEFGVYRWIKITSIDDILESSSYGVRAKGSLIVPIAVPDGSVIRVSDRVIKARLSAGKLGVFQRGRDEGRWFRLAYGETTIYAQVTGETIAGFSRQVTGVAGSSFAAMSDLTDMVRGLSAFSPSLPSGTFIVSVQEYVPAKDVYKLVPIQYPGGFIRWESRLDYTAPEVPSGVYLSSSFTSSVSGPVTFGESAGIDTVSITALLSRSLPTDEDGKPYNGGISEFFWRGAFFPGNYPSLVSIHEERLVLAASTEQPQTLWFSKTGDYYDFSPVTERTESLDDNGITVSIASSQLDSITWILSKGLLLFGTASAEWVLSSGSQRQPFTARNVTAVMQTSYGSRFQGRTEVGREVLFIQNNGSRLRQMRFDVTAEGHVSKDLTVRSDHILSKYGGGREILFAQNPQGRAYIRCASGDILSLTYEPDQEVYAWSHFSDASCASFASVQRGGHSVLYMAVVRPVVESGQSFSHTYLEEIDLSDPQVFLDSWRTVIVQETVPAFAGKTVVFVDGLKHSDPIQCDKLGNYVLPEGYTVGPLLKVGLPYSTVLETYPLEAQSELGPGLGRFQSIVKTCVRTHESGGMEYTLRGGPFGVSAERSYRLYGDKMDRSAPLSSDDHDIHFTPNIGPKQTIRFSTSRPWPLTILSLCHTVDQK